jgi:hypothetical protein
MECSFRIEEGIRARIRYLSRAKGMVTRLKRDNPQNGRKSLPAIHPIRD